MLAAFTLQAAGNSTPRCSKLIEPSRQFVITTSRRSQSTSSYGWTPSVVHTRSTRRPPGCAPPCPRPWPPVVPTAPVMPSPSPARRAAPRPRSMTLPYPSALPVLAYPSAHRRRLAGPARHRRLHRYRVPPRHPVLPDGQRLLFARRAQRRDLALEVTQRVEGAVDAGEPQVRHLVQVAQRTEDGQPDLVARHLGRAP